MQKGQPMVTVQTPHRRQKAVILMQTRFRLKRDVTVHRQAQYACQVPTFCTVCIENNCLLPPVGSLNCYRGSEKTADRELHVLPFCVILGSIQIGLACQASHGLAYWRIL